jgi:acetoin utilization protein AcuA
VSLSWRQLGLAKAMLHAAFAEPLYEERIILATGLNWCWDLQGTGLDLFAYQRMLFKLIRPFGFTPYDTDDPEIVRYPGNGLVARIGCQVSSVLQDAFAALRYTQSSSMQYRDFARVAN